MQIRSSGAGVYSRSTNSLYQSIVIVVPVLSKELIVKNVPGAKRKKILFLPGRDDRTNSG
jgi:hypothetical protein